MAPDFNLQKAREALKLAKQALKEAERHYDTDRGLNQKPLISRIKVAEAKVQAARVALRRLDPRSTE